MDRSRLQNTIMQAIEEGTNELDLSYKEIESLPPEIGQLRNLEALWLHGNRLTCLPSEIVNLRQVRWLTLSNNAFRRVPFELASLTSLIDLELDRNKLTAFPPQLAQLTNLRRLTLSTNRLRSLPGEVGELLNLEKLHLANNQLRRLPETFGQLDNLTTLDVSCNRLTSIPKSLLKLRQLTSFMLSGNPLESPPPEVAEKGIDAIRRYFRQLEDEGKDRLYEAKLLIVGEAGAGKTSLARKIQNSDYQLQETEKSTDGIDVMQWHFQLADGQPFRVNIWDFGGQEIYHATHQFFLTKRSLYALVADARKEDTDFHYWLNVVDLLSNSSPLVIVQNERQDRHREINERALRGRYANIKDILVTNLATNRGLAQLTAEICHHISRLPHVGTELPKTWVKVRGTIENDERNYIGIDEYLYICSENGFDQEADKLQLSGYLHDLGVCLHFQADDLLQKVVIIRPEWATTAVYRLLDDRTIVENKGRFSPADLRRVWSEQTYAGMHSELLRLMVNFRLCYKVRGKEEYIVPELLSRSQPPYEWDNHDYLTIRYEYEFMPKGILTQLIVAMNAFIYRQDLVWREGVILQRDDTWAEVMEDYGNRAIRIRVVGKHKRDLMTIILYEIDQINMSFDRLKCTKWIPCDCEACQALQQPHFYDFGVLQEFVANGQREIQCQKKPYRMVNVFRLIEGVKDNSENSVPPHQPRRRFRVALSFPGETRPFVEGVASILMETLGEGRVFYDGKYAAELARPDLDTYLQSLYHDESELIVVFLCAEYEEKEWCGLEWRAIRDLIRTKRAVDIMPVRFDHTHVPGLFSIDGYLDAIGKSAQTVAERIIERCQLNDRQRSK